MARIASEAFGHTVVVAEEFNTFDIHNKDGRDD
jgi:hypothetical protein